MSALREALLQLAMAGLGTFAFALIFHVKARNLAAASAGGVLGWLVYLLVREPAGGVFLPSLVAAFFICTWAEAMARALKAPVNVFMIPGLIPIIPGGGLYDTMRAVVDGDRAAMAAKGYSTAIAMVGIVAGILASSLLFLYLMEAVGAVKRRRARKAK